MRHSEYYEEDRDERCDYERHPLNYGYYEDARWM